MANGQEHGVFGQIRTLFDVGAVGGLTDEELLERFQSSSRGVAELAFAVLVERHGPMVQRCCTRILRDEHDAQDAFQATFLVLARKDRSIRNRQALGAWLHGVACRVAASARATAGRRRKHERAAAMREEVARSPFVVDELGPAIHEEIERLPERFRVPIVLCCLEGLTREQAALRLGWRVGTVQSRLARGRERLRVSLARRGIGPVVGTLAAVLSRELKAVEAGLSARLGKTTTSFAWEFAARRSAAGTVPAAVAALSTGVLNVMFLQNMKVAALAVVVGLVVVGVGITRGQGPGDAPKGVTDTGQRPKGAPDRLGDLERKLDRVLEALGQRPLAAPRKDDTAEELDRRLVDHAAKLLEDAKASLAWAERMSKTGYVSEAGLRKHQRDVEAAQLRIDALRAHRDPAPLNEVADTVNFLRGPSDGASNVRTESSRLQRLERQMDELSQRVEAIERRLDADGAGLNTKKRVGSPGAQDRQEVEDRSTP